jgi:hypothetical protein
VKKEPAEEELRSPKTATSSDKNQTNNSLPKTDSTSTDNTATKTAAAAGESITNNSLKELIINELNPEVAEFVPNKFEKDSHQ